MPVTPNNEITDMLGQLVDWPVGKRLALAQQILRTIEGELNAAPPRSKSLMDLMGLLKTEGSPPTDEECRRILEDELLGKYLS
jgi:hypothetical protein